MSYFHVEKEKVRKAQRKQGKRKETQDQKKGSNQVEGTRKVWKEKAPNGKNPEGESLGERINDKTVNLLDH